jgi:pimeloyl-ACP methyl ester carboxylesterase
MSFVLVHGGGHSSRCWEPTVPLLDGPVLAIDLPGRGTRPGPLDQIHIADCVASAVADIEASGLTDPVLVGHSMAGLSLPGIVGELGDRFAHVVFVSCAILPKGTSILDLLPPDLAERAKAIPATPAGSSLTDDEVVAMQCYDMDEEQTRFTVDVVVPEAYWPVREPVDLSGLAHPVGKTWVRLLRDQTFPPSMQDEMAARAGCSATIDLDAGHMAMISRPHELARVLNDIAARAR